jgi:hypothetical protein
VELVDGDWNDSAAIERALKGVEGAFAATINSTKLAIRSSVFCTKRLAWRKTTVDTRSTWRRSFLNNCGQPRTASLLY